MLYADEKLREKMIRKYEEGRYDDALRLSRKLDKRILKYYRYGENTHRKFDTIKQILTK